MTLDQIKSAVDAGHEVYWKTTMYRVRTSGGEYVIQCGASIIGLTWADGTTLNGKPEDFHIMA
jgi:hypothetical protein